MSDSKIKVAILDLYNDYPNEGMRNLKELVSAAELNFEWKVFNVRAKTEIPDISYDIFISSGGPGSPYDGEGGEWESKYFTLMDKIWAHNANGNPKKKYLFAICHSFQLLARYLQLGNVCERRSTAFGVFNIEHTENGKQDKYFRVLPDPFYAVDSRDWQLIQPNTHLFIDSGAEILAIEKRRDHVDLERAVMAVKINPYVYMTQFHPEADADGMLRYFNIKEKKEHVIKNHGEWKLDEMIRCLSDPYKLPLTREALIPEFLKDAHDALLYLKDHDS